MQAPPGIPEGFDHLLEDLYFRLEERDRWADHIIKFLLAANGGGVIVTMGYAGVLAQKGLSPSALAYGLGAFLMGLVAIGFLLFASTFAVRKGRHRIRALMQEMLNDDTKTYSYAFLELGKLKPKWDVFWNASITAFLLFFVGVAFSFVAITNNAPPPGVTAQTDRHIASSVAATKGATPLQNGQNR